MSELSLVLNWIEAITLIICPWIIIGLCVWASFNGIRCLTRTNDLLDEIADLLASEPDDGEKEDVATDDNIIRDLFKASK